MPEGRYHQLVVFMQYICPKPLRRLLYNLGSATLTPGRLFDFDSFLRSEKTSLAILVQSGRISQSQYHRIYHLADKPNINDLNVPLLVILLRHLFGKVLNQDEKNALQHIENVYNFLLHFQPRELLTDEEFERRWSKLEEATLLLAEGVNEEDFEIEISELITNTKVNYVPNTSYNVEDWIAEVPSMQQETDTEKEQCSECKADVTETAKEKRGKDSFQKLRDSSKTFIQKYKDCVFEEPREPIFQTAKGHLREEGVVVIVGSNKSGKTTLAVNLLQHHIHKEVLIASEADDLMLLKQPYIKNTFAVVIDNLGGKHPFKQITSDRWLATLDKIYALSRKKTVKIIITINADAYDPTIKSLRHPLFLNSVVTLTSEHTSVPLTDPQLSCFDSCVDSRLENARGQAKIKKKGGTSDYTRTNSGQFTGNTHLDGKILIHYTVPLNCWPRLHHSQEFIKTLTGYSNELENEIGLHKLHEEYEEFIENVDLFVNDKDFDIAVLSIQKGLKLEQQVSEKKVIFHNLTHNEISGFAGIFIENGRVRTVENITETTISVYDDDEYTNKNHTESLEMKLEISNMIETAIYRPLFRKIKSLSHLLSASVCGITEGILRTGSQESQVTEIVSNRSSHSCNEECTFDQHIARNVHQKKNNIDRLLGEMVALTNRSHLPDNVRPVIKGFETKQISKEIAKDLFQVHPTIKWCGYRYSTLHVHVENIPDTSESELRERRIRAFLSKHDIKDFRLVVIGNKMKEYSYVGAAIQSEIRERATLGCFSTFRKGFEPSVCALLSRHFVSKSGKIFVETEELDAKRMSKLIHFGTVLPETNVKSGLDIAAAEIVEQHIKHLDTRFRNYDNQPVLAYMYENTDNKKLQDQPVYLRGAMTPLGVGTIHIPTLQCSKDTNMTYIQVIGGSYALKKPFERLAVEGDSGAIISMDELGTKNVYIISMLMGGHLPTDKEETETGPKYCSLSLSSGLMYLRFKTGGRFTVQGTVNEFIESILMDILKSISDKSPCDKTSLE